MLIEDLDESALYCVLLKASPTPVSRVVKFETLRGIDVESFDQTPDNHVMVTRRDGTKLAIWFDPTRPELREAKRRQLAVAPTEMPAEESKPVKAKPASILEAAVVAPIQSAHSAVSGSWR